MHLSVMLEATIDRLAIRPGGSYVDATLGGGGHSYEILRRAGPNGRLLGIDRDPAALTAAAERLAGLPGSVVLAQGNHREMAALAAQHGFGRVDGIVLDAGVSSDQLDTPERGFSFRHDGPLDMRMDPTSGESAAQLLARLDVPEMTALFRELGEEPMARRIARAIAAGRDRAPVDTTGRLAAIVTEAVGGRRDRGHHPATRVFQALRMAVNGELEALEGALEDGVDLLAPDGRFAVITFESLSDRLTKHFFAAHVGRRVSLPQGGDMWEGRQPALAWVEKRAIRPDSEEQTRNPRARSAKLRVVRRLTDDEARQLA